MHSYCYIIVHLLVEKLMEEKKINCNLTLFTQYIYINKRRDGKSTFARQKYCKGFVAKGKVKIYV